MTKRDDNAGTVPSWAGVLSPEEWAWFVATLATDLEGRDASHHFDMETGCVRVERSADTPSALNLANLAQVCRARPRDAWPFAVRHHLDMALEVATKPTAEKLAADWHLAREHVKLRLYERSSLPDMPLVTWEVARGLVAVLTFDLPESVNSVRLEDREEWDVNDDDLYDIALANVRGEGLLSTVEIEIGERATLQVLEGGGTFFAASHALFIEQYARDIGLYGVVLAIPHRHIVLYHPIRDAEAVRVIEAMIVSATTMYVDGPGAISCDLFWLPPRGDDSSLDDLNHRLVRLPCALTDDTLRFMPPPRFARMLGSLA